jgi:hypothetical protein
VAWTDQCLGSFKEERAALAARYVIGPEQVSEGLADRVRGPVQVGGVARRARGPVHYVASGCAVSLRHASTGQVA